MAMGLWKAQILHTAIITQIKKRQLGTQHLKMKKIKPTKDEDRDRKKQMSLGL